MALFFDQIWFDATLAKRGVSRTDMAAKACVSIDELTLIFKDQMEVSATQVKAWADMLGESKQEIAKRCGVSTQVPVPQNDAQKVADLQAQLALLEVQIQKLTKQLNAKS